MRAAALMLMALCLPAAVQAAPPEPVQARLESVNVPGREITVNGQPLALSSTVAISVPGKSRAALRDLTPGMNVMLDVSGADDESAVVRSITVLAD